MIIIYIYTINTIIDYSYINECNNTFFFYLLNHILTIHIMFVTLYNHNYIYTLDNYNTYHIQYITHINI